MLLLLRFKKSEGLEYFLGALLGHFSQLSGNSLCSIQSQPKRKVQSTNSNLFVIFKATKLSLLSWKKNSLFFLLTMASFHHIVPRELRLLESSISCDEHKPTASSVEQVNLTNLRYLVVGCLNFRREPLGQVSLRDIYFIDKEVRAISNLSAQKYDYNLCYIPYIHHLRSPVQLKKYMCIV